MRKFIKLAAAAAAAVFTFSGCMFFGGDEGLTPNPVRTFDYSSINLVQLKDPYDGQPTAVIETTLGNITAVLYPDYAPNTVKNFIDRANEGFYNGKDIYCVLDKSIFMSGSLDENRNSGVTGDGELIANEYSVDLWPFKGALCSFNGHTGYGDSRFMALNDRPLSEEDMQELRDFTDDSGEKLPEELLSAFTEKGVIIDFVGRYTVFAQTIEGIDVIEKICSVAVNENDASPVEPIYINKVTISEYHAG